MKTYWVYMLQCFDGSFYVGVTSDLERRYNEHCLGIIEGCYTHTRLPLQLVYAGEFSSIRDAIDFEKKMKRWTHRKKRVFAQKKWNELKDFSVGRERPERLLKTYPECDALGL
ncbi:MAG: GIY-YIG nuclease family protein [Vulcanimicrobiaceae bacterium]